MRFGNTLNDVRQGIVIGFILGLAWAPFGFFQLGLHRNFTFDGVLSWVVPVLFIPAVMTFYIGRTALFSIWISDGYVEHRFLDSYVIERARLGDFEEMESPCGVYAAVLSFRGGAKIRFTGANLMELARLREELALQRNSAEAKQA